MSLFADYAPGGGGAPPGDLELRRAAPEDVPALAAMTAAREGLDEAELAGRFAREIASTRDDHRLWVAVAGAAPERRAIAFGRARRYERAADAPPDHVPDGWYLSGVIVEPAWRRRGVARALTAVRLAWIAERAREAYFVANLRNRPSIDLHAEFGFVRLERPFTLPGVTYAGGEGGLFRAELARGDRATPRAT